MMRSAFSTVGIPELFVMRTIYVTPWMMSGRLIVVDRSRIVPGHVIVVVVPGYVLRGCSISVRARGINKTNLFGSDEEIREYDRSGGGINRVSICLRGKYPTDLSIVVVASTYVPEVGEVVEAMGYGLELGYAMSTELFIEGKIVGYLSDMKGARECIGSCRITD